MTTTGTAADVDAGEEGKLGDSCAGGSFSFPLSDPDPVPAIGTALDTAEETVPASAGEEVKSAAAVAVGSMGNGSAADNELAASVPEASREEAEGQGL